MLHFIVYSRENTFADWPANNGSWYWKGLHGKDELLVGFTAGGYLIQEGHNIAEPYESLLARSLDGGRMWRVEKPETFLHPGTTEQDFKTMLDPIDFHHPHLALRIVSTGYHGNNFSKAGFYYSLDRGHTWSGPFRLEVMHAPQLVGLELTPRTDYLPENSKSCVFFLSGRKPADWGGDRVFCARTMDGGFTFQFVSWIVSPADPNRAVMPSTIRTLDGEYVTAIRRRDMRQADGNCWIDAYYSDDCVQSWSFLSRVAETGMANGNPPALALLQDGRLCCVYGNRAQRKLLARFSADNGRSWEKEITLREGYYSGQNDQDFGYPRLFERSDGGLAAVYYWADRDLPRQHIAVTLWDP